MKFPCHCSFSHLLFRSICSTGNSSQQTSLQCLSTINMVFRDQDKILSSYCSRRLQSSLHQTCGRQTAQPWTLSTTVSGVSCRNEFTRHSWSQAAPHWDLVEHSTGCHRRSHWRVGAATISLRQSRDVTRCNQPALFRATHILSKKIAVPSCD